MIGKKLAHYEITAELGKGGMGEVWRTRDTKLGREVAIKTLPEDFAADAQRLARFEREARLLASLNHPNIAAIYGLEAFEGTRFLVLELVEGETLSERLKRGPLSIEESLALARQVTEALEAAHDKGVIHRDLKPANIKLTPDGKIKVLDYGLAKALTGDAVAEADLASSPTLSMQATRHGVILGTAAYMSPEQGTGRSCRQEGRHLGVRMRFVRNAHGTNDFRWTHRFRCPCRCVAGGARLEPASAQPSSETSRGAGALPRKRSQEPVARHRRRQGRSR